MKKYSQEQVRAFIEPVLELNKTTAKMQDIYEMTMSRNAKEVAYIYFDENGKPRKNTYEDFRNSVFKTAAKLSRCLSGTRPGSVVGLKLKNSPKWPIFFWAILMTGHAPLLIDFRLPQENANNLLTQSKAQAIVSNDDFDFCVPKFKVGEVLNEPDVYDFSPDWADHVIFCSSGTTGDAKMMVYNGANLVSQIVESYSIPDCSTELMHPGKIRILAMLPFHHIFGFAAVFLWYSFYGKAIVYPSSMATTDLLYAVKKGKCTHVFSVPTFWDSVAQAVTRKVSMDGGTKADLFARLVAYNTKKISKSEAGLAARKTIMHAFQKAVLGKHVRFAISGGGFISPKTLNTINGLGYPLYNGYGMTEIGIASVEQSPDVEQRLRGSIGKPFYGVEYRIGEEGQDIGPDESGQLYVRSATNHSREIIGGIIRRVDYSKDWFPTGDIAIVDKTGNYFLRGRIKDTIILANGENVFPDEIEYYFKDVTHINNAVCLGAKKKGDDEEKITLVCEVDNSVDEEAIKKIYADIKKINDTLPNEKKVQSILIDKSPLPMSGSLKVKRFAIKEAIEAGSEDFVDLSNPQKATVVTFDEFNPEDVAKVNAKVLKIFSKVLSLPEFKIEPKAIWTVDLGGDSMNYIEMCELINEEFDIAIDKERYGQIYTVNDFTHEVLILLESKSAAEEKKGKKNKGQKDPK